MSNAAAALLCALALSSPPGGEEHLLAGARHFREGRYAEALVEFRVAETLGARDAAAYSAASLVKLERWEDAIEAFGTGTRVGRDALLDFYRALACYGARLYVCADAILAALPERSGPKLAEQATRIRSELAAHLALGASHGAVAWYASRCVERRREGRAAVADAYCREADALARRSTAAPGEAGGPATPQTLRAHQERRP